ncbi:DUF445 family protein [Paraliobacillus sediminis]|uniref:DUF445 family protein n=1 Tax=Paraliobacillus sediminis TaxID=1885916 RepID=UPI000E3E8189|nr:DUF445 family protein [Paraliobacillus sediminis]
MSPVVIVIIMIGIGALIGGITNSLAIKMLFRPHEAKYIGTFKIPFTPGLIPKRKEELAKQLGKMVVEHLITVEGIQNKLFHADFKIQIEKWFAKELDRFIHSDQTIRMLVKKINLNIDDTRIKESAQKWLKSYQKDWMDKNGTKHISEIIDPHILEEIEPYLPDIAAMIQQKVNQYIAGEAAANKMQELIDTYFTDKGFLGNMLASVFGGKTVVDKIQPIFVNYTQSDDMQAVIEKLLRKEWDNVLLQSANQVEEKIGQDRIATFIDYAVETYLPVNEMVDKPIRIWLGSLSPLVDQVVTGATTQFLHVLNKRIGPLLHTLGLEEIVEKEVQAFPLKRVEELVLNISRKELKLITYLGALLGGLIGLIQGIIIVLVG